MSKSAALHRVTDLWNTHQMLEMPRLDRIDRALKVDPPISRREFLSDAPSARHRYTGSFQPTVSIPDDAPPIMWELARKARTNYLPLLVRVFRQALRVEGYLTAAPDPQNPWRWWQANRLDARQVGIHDAALKYGASYLLVVPGDRGPAARGFSPRKLAAFYADPEMDEWPQDAVYVDGADQHLVLVDEEVEYRFGIEDRGVFDRAAGPPSFSRAFADGALTFIESRAHGVGVCPVVRYRDSHLLEGEEQFGIVEPLIVVQERMDEGGFGQLVAQYFAAFKQRAVIGWVPQSEAEELKAGASRIWYLDVDKNEVDIRELTETDLTRYIESGKAARRDFASLGQIPAGDLGVDAISNISDATLQGLERSKNVRAGEIALALGESHEQSLRLMARIAGDVDAAQDWNSEIRWAEREARTWAAQIDGLVKLVQSQVLTEDTAITMVPGMTDQQVELARGDSRRKRASANVTAMRAARAAASPPQQPSGVTGQQLDAAAGDGDAL